MNLNKMSSFSLLSRKKLSILYKKNAGENVYNLCSNGEKNNAGGNFLSLFFFRRSLIAIGAILCVILQNTCTFENKKSSQLGLTARFSRKLIEKSKDEIGEMSNVLAALDVLWKWSPLPSVSALTAEKLDSRKNKKKGKVLDMEELRERCHNNGKDLDEYEIGVMLNYLTQPGCFSKIYALGTWWQVRKREKKEWDNFYIQLSRLCKDTAYKCNYSSELSDKLLKEAQDDYTQRAKNMESAYNDKIYDLLNKKDKAPKDYKDNVNKYQNDQEDLRDQFWDEWEKYFNEEMSGEPFVKGIIKEPAALENGE
ncbi:Uncharacterized protein PCOAH_00019470 [Plasmodium coatneyi]|uniref:Plasmodium RESA N-terminal domain-containing protein n=1 Tax=Plasmodium coatneyi TaxID=208452 RepID=A0A1B1DYC4_9APIC|nr:Uncharacterized protein PCOAH_00019470 [Plasmodium coatneyi]ANQ07619.1 Uncharacterized protein PCOAH_00019470 [Plasmodium coatneyi]